MIYLTHFCLLLQFEPHETFAYASCGSAKTQTATKMHQKKKQKTQNYYKETWNSHKDITTKRHKQLQRCETATKMQNYKIHKMTPRRHKLQRDATSKQDTQNKNKDTQNYKKYEDTNYKEIQKRVTNNYKDKTSATRGHLVMINMLTIQPMSALNSASISISATQL